jgi:hypothetical protein
MIVAFLCATLSGVGAFLWVRHQQSTEALVLPSTARIQRVDGEVGLNRSIDNTDSN